MLNNLIIKSLEHIKDILENENKIRKKYDEFNLMFKNINNFQEEGDIIRSGFQIYNEHEKFKKEILNWIEVILKDLKVEDK